MSTHNTYIDELAPWEMKKGYYQNIELGRDVFAQRTEIRNQIREMIANQIELTSTAITSREIIDDTINSLAYETRNIENGAFGLKAAFEWNISEVVWQIEQNTKAFKKILNTLYMDQDGLVKEMRKEAQEAYEKGEIANVLEIYLEMSQTFRKDFSINISLGIIYLFYEVKKEKALDCFSKAVESAKVQSVYYTSYALLYKALILRDLGHFGEAEECTKQAIDLTPNFTEAIYQNAQYNALLKSPGKTIPLLKEVINKDIVYCLKISNEQDFNEIGTEVTKMFEDIRGPQIKSIKNKQKAFDEKLFYFIYNINNIKEQGNNISYEYKIKLLKEEREELAYMINYNSIIDTYVVNYGFSQLDVLLNRHISSLIDDCKRFRNRLENQKKEVSNKLLEVKKKRSFLQLFIYTLFSQVYAIPIGLSMSLSSGILIIEAVAFVSCFALVIILPRLKWKRIYYLLERKGYLLDQIVNRIRELLFK